MKSPRDDAASQCQAGPSTTGDCERDEQPRHRLRDAIGTLGWWENGQEFSCAMTIAQISAQSATVLAGCAPPPGKSASILLQSGAAGTEPLQARVASASVDVFGKLVVRLHFTRPIALEPVLAKHEERRSCQRCPARETRASLIWLDPDVGRLAPGKLINISGGGAAVATHAALPEQRSVWLTLNVETGSVTPVRCRLVSIAIDASGSRIARLKFVEPCPIDLFELAVHGAP
jgi:hypothetical protein